jgi:ribose transport system permease protein
MVLAGTIQSGDATVGPIFTVTSLAGMALGGVSLAGGRGGLLGAALGGATYYLIQNLLTIAHVSVYQLSMASGAVLIFALAVNGLLEYQRRRQARA